MSPFKAKHPCNKSGCHRLTATRFCDEHERDMRKHDDEKRGSASERGYDATWARVRIMKLNEEPLCERCHVKQIDRNAVLVHHRDRNPRNNDMDNLESLCDQCHDKEHEKERWGR